MNDFDNGSAANSEKRRLDRVDIGEIIRVLNRLDKRELGRIANIHEEGFMMIGSDDAVFDGGTYQLDLIWEPSQVEAESREFSVGAQCLWCRPSGDQFWSGFSIIDKGEKDLSTIKEIVAKFSKN